MAKVSAQEKAAGGPLWGRRQFCLCSAPHPICCLLSSVIMGGSVTTLDWVLLTDRTFLNLSLSPAPSAEPGKTRGAWSTLAE